MTIVYHEGFRVNFRKDRSRSLTGFEVKDDNFPQRRLQSGEKMCAMKNTLTFHEILIV